MADRNTQRGQHSMARGPFQDWAGFEASSNGPRLNSLRSYSVQGEPIPRRPSRRGSSFMLVGRKDERYSTEQYPEIKESSLAPDSRLEEPDPSAEPPVPWRVGVERRESKLDTTGSSLTAPPDYDDSRALPPPRYFQAAGSPSSNHEGSHEDDILFDGKEQPRFRRKDSYFTKTKQVMKRTKADHEESPNDLKFTLPTCQQDVGSNRDSNRRPSFLQSKSSGIFEKLRRFKKQHPEHSSERLALLNEEENRVILDAAAVVDSRKYIKSLARALVAVGAPSHRLEEYLTMSGRALGIEGDFTYLPGLMLITFNDKAVMSSEVNLIKESQGLDLGKFQDIHYVYKAVVHGYYTAQEGVQEITAVMVRRQPHSESLQILAYGMAGVAIGSFNFSMRPMDFVPCFILGCVVGILQLIAGARSSQFSHLVEVCAAILVAFVSRGLGSIPYYDQPMFCFSAIAYSSIVVLLPGYTVLCAALELQNQKLAAGAARMVYAIIYSLFLGFGFLVGMVLMGMMSPNAQSNTSCQAPQWWDASNLDYKLLYVKFLWVPVFAACIAIIFQAKWAQVPVMALIAFVSYEANFWISTALDDNSQVGNAAGAFIIGVMGNLYSRMFHGLAAAAMLPAIIVQVPGGIAARLNLKDAIASANAMTGHVLNTTVANTSTVGTISNVGYTGMVEVAVGSSVGFFLSALLIYPVGKKRSGLFTY